MHHESTQVDSSTCYEGYTHESCLQFTRGLQVPASDIHMQYVLCLRLNLYDSDICVSKRSK